ncbi:hypothetical protein KDRO_D07470 [Kluyveromyces lactis]|nr:hypothetical protein KDRO_D07470 [Kluyveromyces lactis]
MCLELESNLDDYFKACTYAYYSDYENFIKYYDIKKPIDDDDDLNFHLCVGIRNSYNFAVKMENSGLKLTNGMLSSISARYIMSNKVCEFNFKYLPVSIWYPNIPSKETCTYLLEKVNRYSLVIKTMCVLLGWEDICNKCDNICTEDCYRLSILLNRESFCSKDVLYKYEICENKTILEKFEKDIYLNKDYVIEAKETTFNRIFRYNFTKKQSNWELIIDDTLTSYIDYSENTELGPMNCASVDKSVYYNMISYKPYLDINMNTVEFNFLNSVYVLKHHKEYPDDLCRKAVTNLLVNDIFDEYYLDLYTPFYFYTYKTINEFIIKKLLINYLECKYAICVNYAITNKIPQPPERLHPDIDLMKIAYASGSFEFYNYMMEMAKEEGGVYKHMDFENEKFIVKFYKYEDVDFDNLHKNNGHPLLLRATHLNFP